MSSMSGAQDRMGWNGEDDMEGVVVTPPSGPDMEPDPELLAEIARVDALLIVSGYDTSTVED